MRFDLNHIQHEIGSTFSRDELGLPLQRFLHFVEKADLSELRLITINQIAEISGLRPTDGTLIRLVSLMTSAQYPILELAFMFDNGDEEYQVSDMELKEARQSGFFVDRSSGETVADYEKYLLPFFHLSKELKAYRSVIND